MVTVWTAASIALPPCESAENHPQPLALLPDFNLFHMIAVGLSSSILGCLVTLLVYSYCQRYQQQSHDATVIHPISAAPLNTSITNHINKLDKYDTVEAIKVCRLYLPRVRRGSRLTNVELFTGNISLLFDLISWRPHSESVSNGLPLPRVSAVIKCTSYCITLTVTPPPVVLRHSLVV